MPNSPVVLDSWAMLALIQDEPSAAKVEAILVSAQSSGAPLLMCVVNAGEVWYNTAREHSAEIADQKVAEIAQIGVEIVPVDWDTTYLAARYKARGGISYADCFALALAKQRRAELVTGDREFKPFEREVKIRWV